MNTHNDYSGLLPAVEAEISKAKRRLDEVFNDVEILRKEKTVIDGDIERKTKHVRYLDELTLEKEEEVSKKQSAISNLDTQIEDKQTQANKLQSEVSQLSDVLQNTKSELIETEKKILEHTDMMKNNLDSISEKHRQADEMHHVANEKIAKLQAFLNEIQ